ncbi:hypothetical protein JNM05_06600 [bacterium]|nr:hypothetical protein [bacterium]
MKLFSIVFAAWISVYCHDITAQEVKPRYFYGSVNYMFPKYTEPLASRASFASRVPQSAHVPLHLDAVGYYFGHGKLTLIGVVMQIDIDRYSAYSEKLQIENYQPSFSVFHYLDGQIGSGLFIRGDLGPAFLRISSNDQGTEKSNLGWGYLFGTGASLAVPSTTLFASVNYAHKSFHGKSYQFISLGLGFMLRHTK